MLTASGFNQVSIGDASAAGRFALHWRRQTERPACSHKQNAFEIKTHEDVSGVPVQVSGGLLGMCP